jgi:hypothetical protein
MADNLTYKEIAVAKSGEAVPIFASGGAMYSLYNPARDAEAFAESFFSESDGEKTRGGFAVVFGIGSGLHITALSKKNPALEILAVEHSARNIEFLKKNAPLSELLALPNVSVCTLDELSAAFLSSYIPVLHGGVRAGFQQAWKNTHPEDCAEGARIIARAAEDAKSDYATQAHFGKIWHRNILLNIAAINESVSGGEEILLPLEKTACVVAAGPSLDKSAETLSRNREEKFVIATDTAYPALLGRGIFPDAVVTIDGQAVSARHFLAARRPFADGGRFPCVLFADLCCNPASPRLFRSRGQPVVFVKNGHPLSVLASRYARRNGAAKDFLPLVSSGAGTVTASAASLAFKSGFSRVRFFGADFAYTGGKPYARGTYLDGFFSSSSRASPGETAFASLMYRGALCPTEDGAALTTPLLLSYKKSLEALEKSETRFPPLGFPRPGTGVLDGFSEWYANRLSELLADRKADALSGGDGIPLSCLPLLANRKAFSASPAGGNAHGAGSKKDEIFYALKLAYEATKRYTQGQWK